MRMRINCQTETNFQQYLKSIRKDHRTHAIRAGFSLYAWFWFHTQFWLAPIDRRPYTFIIRDWIYPRKKWFLAIIITWYALLLAWINWSPYPAAILTGLSSWLNAHLVWGGKWKQGEQEWPPYTGED